jgi:hypothetical protein
MFKNQKQMNTARDVPVVRIISNFKHIHFVFTCHSIVNLLPFFLLILRGTPP